MPGKIRTCESGEVWVQAGEGEGPSVAAENLKSALTIYLREYLLGVFRSPRAIYCHGFLFQPHGTATWIKSGVMRGTV